MTLTREHVGRGLGIALLAVLIVGLPYLIMSFCLWQMDPSLWDTTARALAVFAAGLLLSGRLALTLPASEPEVLPRYDAQTGAQLR